MRTLLLVPVVVAVIGACANRMQHNRQQRDAVHTLWQMGVLTSDEPDQVFWGPGSNLDWVWHDRENWLDDLVGTHRPIFVGVMEPSGSQVNQRIGGTDVDRFANAINSIASVQEVFVQGRAMDANGVERIRYLLPHVRVHHDQGSKLTR